MTIRKPATALLVAALISTLIGCGEPKIARNNLRLTMALRTAVSAKQAEWLEACRKQVNERRDSGEMSQEEYDRFQKVFARADRGEWESAERDLVSWQRYAH